MNLTRLRYFVVTAEEENVGRAARRLRVAQPALSRQLAALEKEVGTPLLERHARGIRLLPAGAAFLAHARRVLAEADGAVSAARSASSTARGKRLCIAIPDWPARAGWVASAIEQLRARRPDIDVVHATTLWLQSEAAILAGQVDVGFAVALGPGEFASDLEATRIGDEPAAVAILPATHPLAHQSSLTLADLRDETLLVPPRESCARIHDLTVATVRAGGYEPRVAAASPSFAVSVQMVIAGAGWIIAVNSGAEGLAPGARAVPIADAEIVLGLYLLRRRGNQCDAIDDFLHCLRDVARNATPRQPANAALTRR